MQGEFAVLYWSACPCICPLIWPFVRLTQVGMCVVQEVESELTSSQQDSVNIITDLRSEASHLKTLLEDKEGKSKEAQQQREAAEAQSAVQLANLKTCLDTELAALRGQLESEQKRQVAAQEQHKAAQADLALAAAVAEQLKSDQAVLLTEVKVVNVSVKQVLSDRYVMHWCPPQAINPMLLACMPVVSAPLALGMHSRTRSSCCALVMHCAHTLVSVALHYQNAVLQGPLWSGCRQVASILASRCTFATVTSFSTTNAYAHTRIFSAHVHIFLMTL